MDKSFAIYEESVPHPLVDTEPVQVNKLKKQNRIFRWFSGKFRQIQRLLNDDTLTLALTSPVREPVEGARFEVGDRLHCSSFALGCRELQVCGIQSGGFSNVYTVIDTNEMLAYCLKGNRATTKHYKEPNKMLLDEARVWLKLGNHPNIVAAKAVVSVMGDPHILIEYVSGEDLSQYCKRYQPDPETVSKYALQLCRAMVHTQAAIPGFIHSDIKAGNCLITDDGDLKLTDFGLAIDSEAAPDDEEPDRLSETRAGTLAYMAPEKFNSEHPVSIRTDVYAFGIFLFEMLSGERPFKGPGKAEFRQQHLDVQPPYELLRAQNVTAEMIGIVKKCLEKNPQERFESFRELEQLFEQIYLDQTGEALPYNSGGNAAFEEFVRADAYASVGDFGLSLECIESVLRNEPQNADAHAFKSRVLLASGELAEAAAVSQRAVNCGIQSSPAYYSRALTDFANGRPAQALGNLETALRITPRNARVLNSIGEIQRAEGRLDHAERYFRDSIEADRFHVEPFLNLAAVHSSRGDFEQALDAARKAVDLDGNKPETWKMLGDCYLNLSDFTGAAESYKQSIELGDDSKLSRKGYLKACSGLYKSPAAKMNGKLVRAIINSLKPEKSSKPEFLQEAIDTLRNEGHSPLVLYFLDFGISRMRERSEETVGLLGAELALVFEQAGKGSYGINPYHSVGRIYYEFDLFDECIQVFEKALGMDSGDEKALYFLGACHEVLEDFGDAQNYYRRALKLNPKCELNRTGNNRVASKLDKIRKTTGDAPVSGIEVSSGRYSADAIWVE